MSQNSKTRVELDIILKKKPGCFIRWGLIVFVMIVTLLFLLAYYIGYDILPIFSTKH
jgi:small-conductance mechanosensitive channel